MNKIKRIISFQQDFSHLSPKDLEEIMETLEDMEFLSESGRQFRKEFWELLIKQKD